MASITRRINLTLPPQDAWQAVRDVGQAHVRLFPRMLTQITMDSDSVRTATFANGLVVRELIVDIDDAQMRVVYASVGGRATHHNASLQVLPQGEGRSCIVWITDVLPHELAPAIAALMDGGVADIEHTLKAPGG